LINKVGTMDFKSMCPWPIVASLGIALLCVACSSPSDPDRASWMSAAIVEVREDAEEVDYTGTANFGRTGDFSIASRGNGASEDQTVILVRAREGLPGEGSYVVRSFGTSDGGFGALYRRVQSDGTAERFASVSGWARISESADDRVEGTFEFTAELFCSTPPGADQSPSCHPGAPIEGSVPVIVRGSFSAGPYGPVCRGSLGADCS
jgi:hypothetical protein